MKKSSLHSLKAYMSDESNSSDNQRTDERNRSKQTQKLDESIPTTDVCEKSIYSSSLNTRISTRKKKYIKKKSKQKDLEKNSKKKHKQNISTAKCYETKEEQQTNCLSDGLLVKKNHRPTSAFSFSLLSYFKEPIEGSHLSDYELEQDDFLSNWPAEVKKESDIVPPKLTTKPSHLLVPELEKAISLPSSPAKAKKDLDKNLRKESVKSIHLSDSEMDENSSSSSSPVKKDFGSSVLSSIKEPVEVICLSDTDLEEADSTSKSPTRVEKQKDADSHSLMPCSKAASLSSEFELKSSASFGEHAENLSETNLNAHEKNIHSSSQNLSIIDQKKQCKKKHQEQKALENSRKRKSLVSNEYLNISDCEESSHWSSDEDSLQESKESPHVFKCVPLTDTNDPVSPIPLPLVSESSKRSHSVTEEYSTPSLSRSRFTTKEDVNNFSLRQSHSRTEEDISTLSLKQSHSRSKDFSTPSSKRSDSRWSKDSSTPSSKQSHSRTEEDISVSFLKEIDSSTKDFCTPSSKRSQSRTGEDVSTPSLKRHHSSTIEDSSTSSLKRSNLICGYLQKDDDRDVSANLSMLDKSLSSVPSPLLPPGETLLPLSFYKMVPPPSLKRSDSLIQEDSENNNKHLFQKSTDNHESYNFASSDSPIIRGRRSLPAKTREDFSTSFNYSTFHSSTHSVGHSSSFQFETPKRTLNSSDSSRRHSYHDKYSPRSSYRSCATDQTPYSPADSYRRHKRFKSELPYYNPSDLLTFQSDVGFIDSHCHLDFLFDRLFYDGSFKDYQRKNKDTFPVCFMGCIAIFCNPPTFKRKRFWQDLLAEENVWASFGCHPHFSKHYDDEVEELLIRALNHPKVCALGEIGLDYSRKNDVSKDIQEKVFIRQLKIALKKKLPLVIHCRDAHEDGLEIMKRMVPKKYFIHLHCFTDTWEIAQKWLEEFPNLYIGLTNLVTFPSAAEVHEVAKKIPLNRLLLETDAPYFIPKPLARHPSSPKWSHPGMAIHVAAQIAALKEGIPLELVLYKTRQNTKAVYKI